MRSHYAITAAIRYYGQLPTDVRVENGQIVCSPPPKLLAALGVMTIPEPGMRWTRIRHNKPFSFSVWKEPPHVVFANLQIDRRDLGPVVKFTREYGQVVGTQDGGVYRVHLRAVAEFQSLVRRAWQGDADDLQTILRSSDVRFSIGPKEKELSIGTLPSLIAAFTLQDCSQAKLGECANPECPAPFFLKVRRGQNFCSHRCAVLINVRRFREREKHLTKRRKS
jgi:hypothetical protein